jgi:hypothetical protein
LNFWILAQQVSPLFPTSGTWLGNTLLGVLTGMLAHCRWDICGQELRL